MEEELHNKSVTSTAFGDVEAYKVEVEESKKRLRRQLVVLLILSFIVCVVVFLAFYWVVPLN
jgi:Zn-finger domain-containing protein